MQIASGELEETRYFLILGRDLKYVDPGEFGKLSEICDSVGQLINALGRSLKGAAARG